MRKFLFKLEGVLRQRRQLEREHQRIVAEKQVVVNRLTEQLRMLDRQVQQSIEDVRNNRLVGGLDLAFLAAHRRYTLAMQRQAVEQARRIVAAQQALDAARSELSEAAKRRKIIEKLREKRYQQWKADADRAELMQMDEVGMQMALSRAGANS